MLISFSDADYKALSKGLTANTDTAQYIRSVDDLLVLEEFYEFCQQPNEAEMEFLGDMVQDVTGEVRLWCKSAQPSAEMLPNFNLVQRRRRIDMHLEYAEALYCDKDVEFADLLKAAESGELGRPVW